MFLDQSPYQRDRDLILLLIQPPNAGGMTHRVQDRVIRRRVRPSSLTVASLTRAQAGIDSVIVLKNTRVAKSLTRLLEQLSERLGDAGSPANADQQAALANVNKARSVVAGLGILGADNDNFEMATISEHDCSVA
jgi:hypothetical protein